ncbi:MAG: putative ATPase/tetratricopeptide (TPR) repeat protein, partial [Kiritimatiellia bacterium]
GRQAELAALGDRISDGARAVVITGPGGTGKTRLVLEYARSAIGDWPGGVLFIDLSEARGLDGIAICVGRALNVPLGGGDFMATLGQAICGRDRTLLVFDNFEQVVEYAEVSLGRWMDAAPNATFIVTSRQVLGLPGEVSVPLESLTAVDSEELFMVRARSAKNNFAPNNEDRAAIVKLTALLDHLPLALELAAARVRILPPRKLLVRMADRFRLLTKTGGRRDRRATLRTTIDWSWNLLDAGEQATLAQLSVFEGGFDLEAAEAVVDLDDPEAPWTLDLVQALVDKSLVRTTSDGRFNLLMSVHEYAQEKLQGQAGRLRAEMAHGQWFSQYGSDSVEESLFTHGGTAARACLALETDNLVAACRRAIERADAEVAVLTLCVVWTLVLITGPCKLVVDLSDDVLRRTSPTGRSKVRAQLVQVQAATTGGNSEEAHHLLLTALDEDPSAWSSRDRCCAAVLLSQLELNLNLQSQTVRVLTEGLQHARATGNVRAEADLLNSLGIYHRTSSHNEKAASCYEGALALYTKQGNEIGRGRILLNTGNLRTELGQFVLAQMSFTEALRSARLTKTLVTEAFVWTGIATVHARMARFAQSLTCYRRSLALHRVVGNRKYEAVVLSSMGSAQCSSGDYESSLRNLRAALAIQQQIKVARSIMFTRGLLGTTYLHSGDLVQARHQLQIAQSMAGHNTQRFEGSLHMCFSLLALGEGDLVGARDNIRTSEALIVPTRDALFIGLMLCARSQVEAAEEHLDEALATLDEARKMASELGVPADGELGCGIARAAEVLGR